MEKIFTFTILTCFLFQIIGCTKISQKEKHSQGTDHLATIKKFLEARGRKDKAAYMRLVAPGMKVWYEEKKGEGTAWNPENAWARWDEFFQAQKKYGVFSHDSDSVSVVVHEMNDFYQLIDRAESPTRLTWWLNTDGKIEGQLVRYMGSKMALDRLGEFELWAKEHHPGELAYLMPGGVINPEGDRPERWKKILLEWRKKSGLPDLSLR